MTYTISKKDMESLLGRPLSDYETGAYDSLLETAKQKLNSEIGAKIDGIKGKIQIELYPGVITPLPFFVRDKGLKFYKNDNTELTYEGILALNNDLNSDVCNRVVFTKQDRRKKYETFIKVEAVWGFGDDLPADLKMLWAKLFEISAVSGEGNGQQNVKSETILSHKVDFAIEQSLWDKFAQDNADVISKWRQEPIAYVEGY